MLYDLQKINPQRYVHYSLAPFETEKNGDKGFYSTCPLFTSEKAELFSCYQILADYKKTNDQSYYEFYIDRCVQLGISEREIRNQMELQTMMDYLVTNTDRHFSNFGLLRDPDTLEFIGCAPIYDSGNSMFYNAAYTHSYKELTTVRINSFLTAEYKMLGYVKNRSVLNLFDVFNSKEIIEFYTNYYISREKATAIAGNFQKKLELLKSLQMGDSVSVQLAAKMDDLVTE